MESPFILCIFAQMPNKKAKERKYRKKKAREAIKKYKRQKKTKTNRGVVING